MGFALSTWHATIDSSKSQRTNSRSIFSIAAVSTSLSGLNSPSKQNKADEEPVDQKKMLEDACKARCARAWRAYEDCVIRIKDDDSGTKHCTGQYFDYWHCVDRCVAPKLFSKLK